MSERPKHQSIPVSTAVSDTTTGASCDTPGGAPDHKPGDTPHDTPHGRVAPGGADAPVTSSPGRPSQGATRQDDALHDPVVRARLMDAASVATFLGVHVKTIHRWRRTRALPCIRIGGRVRFFPSAVLQWLSARKEE